MFLQYRRRSATLSKLQVPHALPEAHFAKALSMAFASEQLLLFQYSQISVQSTANSTAVLTCGSASVDMERADAPAATLAAILQSSRACYTPL